MSLNGEWEFEFDDARVGAVLAVPEAGGQTGLLVRATDPARRRAAMRPPCTREERGEPVIRYEDRSDTPLLHGKAGFKSIDAASRFDQASLTPL